MEVVLGQVLSAVEALGVLCDKELPPDLSFRASRILLGLGRETQAYPESERALFEKYGEAIEGGLGIPLENRIAFRTDMALLRATEMELGAIRLLPWVEIKRALEATGQTIKGNHILALEWLLDMTEEDVAEEPE